MGSTLNAYLNKFEEFKALPAGQSFTIRVIGLKLSVDNPSISFRDDEIRVSASGGMGFLKAKAALTAEVKWDGKPVVAVRSVEIPFLPVTPEKLNSVVEGPLKKGTGIVEQYAEIRSLKVTDGAVVLEAVRK